MTVPRAQVSTHRGRSSRSYPLTNYQFQMIAGSSLFFPMIHMKYVVFMSLWPLTVLRFWFQTDLGRKNSASFLKIQAGKTFCYPWSRVSHALRPIFMLWLVNLCSILFCVNLWCFNRLFPLDVQNEIQLLSQVFCYSWLVCLLGFWLINASLVKIR